MNALPSLGSDEFYLKKPEQMDKLFSDIPEAISNTWKLPNAVDVKFKMKDDAGKPIYHLPTFPTEDGVDDQGRNRSARRVKVCLFVSRKPKLRGEASSRRKKARIYQAARI